MSHNVYEQHFQLISEKFKFIEKKTALKPLEVAFLSIYPITLILGQIIHHVATDDLTKNYFANKSNLVNLIFVKKGWFWTLLALGYLKVQHYSRLLSTSLSATTRPIDYKQFVLFFGRVVIGTVWWIFFTQWFFGIPIMDKIFTFTGGECRYNTLGVTNKKLMGSISSVYCKRKLKGDWTGGHDPSGHVFLLVHSSILIWFELLNADGVVELTKFTKDVKSVLNRNAAALEKCKQLGTLVIHSSSVLALALLGLWLWMLLVTSMHFHSFWEKLSGLFAGYMILLVYLLPRIYGVKSKKTKPRKVKKTK